MKGIIAQRGLVKVLEEVRASKACSPHLPHGPNPILAASPTSCIAIIGQAPSSVAYESGIPWSDRSGDRLREWLGISSSTFYDDNMVAIIPMGFCFPGTGPSGDFSPRAECAPLWHSKILEFLPPNKFTIHAGRYAFEAYADTGYSKLMEAVRDFRTLLPIRIVLPHPLPRNRIWLKKDPWFEKLAAPALHTHVATVLRGYRMSHRLGQA